MGFKYKILVVANFWPSTENSISGIFVAQQVAALSRMGCEITVVVPVPVGRGRARLCSMADLGLASARVRVVRAPFLRLPERLSSLPGAFSLNTYLIAQMLRGQVRRLSRMASFHAVIVHGLRYAGMSLHYWRSSIDGKSVAVVHGVDPFITVEPNRRRALPQIEAMGQSADRVVLVGSPLRAHAVEMGLPESKLTVVSNGTDLPSMQEVDEAQRSTSSCRRIVSVSNLVPLKGVDDNLRALATLAQDRPDLKWEYHIVGDGSSRPSLQALAEELGIHNRVCFLGRLNYEETMQAMADADVFSLPSWGEAFGIVYLEAMARMRPVIGCLGNGAADIITNGQDGLLVEPRNVTALASALEELLTDPALCSLLGRAARKTAKRFTWDENARRMLQLLGISSTALS